MVINSNQDTCKECMCIVSASTEQVLVFSVRVRLALSPQQMGLARGPSRAHVDLGRLEALMCVQCSRNEWARTQMHAHGRPMTLTRTIQNTKDGRFKCQRVEVEGISLAPGSNGSSNASSTLEATQVRRRRSMASELAELELESADYVAEAEARLDANAAELEFEPEMGEEQELGVDGGDWRGKRHSVGARTNQYSRPTKFGSMAPLVCPQIDCKQEDQIRLENDCCTYCKSFDFCAHKSHHRCHPNALCISSAVGNLTDLAKGVKLSELSPGAVALPPRLSIDSMFTCHCKPGFLGDGRFCRDIDECADNRLNDCDPKSTSCINLPGGYECRCKTGYKPVLELQAEKQQTASTKMDAAVTWTMAQTAAPALEPSTKSVRVCADINECADGKLNRCHPQARCINKRGSYKCHCKRGFLGNGIECHKWFSSDPNVAAYLHRHASGGPSAPGASSNGSARARVVNKPLGNLNDPDEDDSQMDAQSRELENNERDSGEEEEEASIGEERVDYDDAASGDQLGPESPVPKLNEAKWEPLKLDSSPPLNLQQVSDARHY